MDFHRKSSCTKELRFRTFVLLVLLVFVNTIYCQQFNATNSSRFTVDCENKMLAENQSELSYIDCKCWHDRPDDHWQHERITKECSSNKMNGKVELTLSQKPNRRYLVEGSMISFMCCSRSWFYQTSKEFQWSVDGRRIRNTGNETMISNNTQYDDNNTICSNLTIDSIGISVTIQCVVNHRYFDTDGTIENSLSLRLHPCVLPRPFVILSPKTPLANDSQMFELSCHLTSSGEEGANFTWYQNGSPINSSFGSVNISLPELKISQLQTSLQSQTDPVKFGCMAKTKLGDTAIQNFTVVSHYNEAYCKSDDYVKELAVPRSLMKIRFDNLESCPDKVEITLRQEPAETYLVEGNNILLICCFRCWLDRYKVREFQWTVYNLTTQNINLTRVIKTNDIHVYYDVNTTICSNQTFNQLSPGLETVQCTVNYSDSNNNGTVDDNLSLRLHLCVLPRPFVTVNPKNLSVYDSQTFALSCQLTSAVEEGANVTWYKDGVLISSVSGSMPNRRQIMSNVSMSLQSQMDAVIFSCMAETRLGRTDLQNSTIAIFDNIGKYCENGDYSVGPTVPPITISEHHQSGNANLTLSWEPNKKYLIDGDSISWKCCFKCECILKNVSDIQWMVNDRIITHNTHQKTISNTSCGSMLVFNADMNLETIQCERNYTCSCEENNSTHDEGNNSTHDEENKSTHDAYLNKRIDPCVLPQPFVTINPKTLRVNDSQMFELSCYLTSAIQECARFTWYKDGNPIDSSSGSVYISYPRLGMSQLQTSLPLRMNPYTIGCNATTKLGNTNRQNSTVIVFDYSGQYCKSDDYDRELAVLQSHKKILFNNSTNCPKTEKGKVEITLRQRPTKKYLVVGDRISLICCFRCWFNRYEAREFQWTFDNQTIRSNWTQMMTISDTYYDVNNSLCSNLTFDQISNGSGTVQCTVNNTYYDNNRPFNDTLRLSLYLFVFPRPFVVINPKSVNVIHSEEFALSCYLTSAVEEGTNFTWYEDGVPINISSERMVSSPKLSISQLTARLQLQKDPIIFGCMAETELGRTGLQNSTIVVVDANDKYCKRNDYDRELSVRQNYMKIRFAILPSSCPNIETGKVELTLHQESITKYLVEGNRISLICCFRTWYSSSCFDGFQWTFNGQTIRNNWTQVTYDTYDVNGATCSNQTFDPISAGSGNVQCNASYSYNDSSNTIKDHLSLSLYLCVFPRPYVTISPKTLLVNDSDMFDFSCHLTSAIEEGANFTWYQDGELIDPFCGGTNITSQGLNTSLLQTSVRLQSHPITFSCVADTQLGMTSLSNSEVTIFDYNAKYCESEQDATMKSINWNRMKVRNVDSHPCQVKGSEGGSCSRMCSLNETSHPVWDAPNCAMCVSMEYRELLQRLEQIQPNQNTTMVAVDIAKNLSALTAQNDTLTQYNLNASLNVISNLTKIRHNETAGVEEVEAVIDVISNLLRPNNSEAWTQLQKENRSVTVSLLRFAEYYGSSLSKTLNNTNKSIIINSDNVVLVAYSMNQSELHGSRDFPASPNSTETRGDKISISINISSLSENRTRMLQVKIFTSYYRNIEDKLPSSNSGIVQSRVLSLTIIDEQGKPQNLMKPVVVVTLQHNKPICRSFERTCSFWNFTEGARVWDATGCSLISTNETHTVCSCNHLTNFAILMSRNPSNSSVLSTMSAVGCSISVTCLILTVIIYIVNWKQWKSDQSAVLLNLCVALIIANIIFLVGSDKTGLPDNAGPPDENCIPDGCKAVAVLLHYFFLAAFFLMLAEGIELLLYIIFVFHVRRKIETASIIAAAWGCPLIIVVISIAVKGMKGYISEYNVCWLSIENGLIWAFAGPAFCIILVNFLILAIIMRRISRARFGATEFEKKRRIRATLWNISVICPVLGVTWAFGILSFSFDHEIFQYLFVVANSLQGMLIFLYHAVLRNKKISEGCCKPKKPKPVSVTHTNPQPTEKEEKKEEKKEEDKEEKTEEKKEEKKEEVTEEKIECVAKLVNFFMSLEKSGDFDASRSFMTTLSLSTEEQSLMNDSEVSVTAAVHSSSDDAPGTSDPDGVAPGGVAPGGVALDGVASDGADSCGIAPGGVVSGEFALGDVAPGGVSQGGITTVEIASASVGPGMVSPDKAVVTEIPTVQEN